MGSELLQYSQTMRTLHKWRLSLKNNTLYILGLVFMFPCLGCISNVMQISAPFMESVYEQRKNAKSFLLCSPPPHPPKKQNYKASVRQVWKHTKHKQEHKQDLRKIYRRGDEFSI